jgi:hypothetical protein
VVTHLDPVLGLRMVTLLPPPCVVMMGRSQARVRFLFTVVVNMPVLHRVVMKWLGNYTDQVISVFSGNESRKFC